jgi:DNA-binding HxlR family transcriptional regulator
MQDLFAKKYDCTAGCPVEATLDLIDGKWKAIILYHLLKGTLRFNELRWRLAKITQRMLTRQLRNSRKSASSAALFLRKYRPVSNMR